MEWRTRLATVLYWSSVLGFVFDRWLGFGFRAAFCVDVFVSRLCQMVGALGVVRAWNMFRDHFMP